ncbi:hypothetical protein, partial [Microcystis aeruginosa]|uniref:hypothetical protein n=1 Tax=Microcystis aeruginosa TaxID=1126 RepID=UPI001C12CA08
SLHNQLLFFSSLGYRTFFCMGCLFFLILPYFLLVSCLFEMTIKVMGEWGEKIPNLGVNQTIKKGFGITKSF